MSATSLALAPRGFHEVQKNPFHFREGEITFPSLPLHTPLSGMEWKPETSFLLEIENFILLLNAFPISCKKLKNPTKLSWVRFSGY